MKNINLNAQHLSKNCFVGYILIALGLQDKYKKVAGQYFSSVAREVVRRGRGIQVRVSRRQEFWSLNNEAGRGLCVGKDLWSDRWEWVEQNCVWCGKGYVRRRLWDDVDQRCVGVRDDGCGAAVSCVCGAGRVLGALDLVFPVSGLWRGREAWWALWKN